MTTLEAAGGGAAVKAARAAVLPLALAQFICSYAASNMNVAISTIAKDIGTSVTGIQTAITLFTLTMAALMIPGSKLTDIFGRKACFVAGLVVYGAGALLALLAQGLPLLLIGYSLLEGIGSALLIPPIYILITILFADLKTRARYFGVVSGAAGLGAAAGPLIGGLVTSYISWRASFGLQVLVVAAIVLLTRRVQDPSLPSQRPQFDLAGAILSAVGLFFVVFGVLQTGSYGWFTAKKDVTIGGAVLIRQGGISPVWILLAIGAVFLVTFFLHVRARERNGGTPLVSIRLFQNKTSNLGLVTQNVQWLVMQGSFFVISLYLQQQRGFDAIKTGVMLIPATAGILLASAGAQRMAGWHPQRVLIRGGFSLTVVGLALLIALSAWRQTGAWTFAPGLFVMGFGLGAMLTASVNVVQSAWPEAEQGDISGVSRSVSNLGSSLGVAIAGSVLVAAASSAHEYGVSVVVVGAFALVGWVAAFLLPRRPAAVTPQPA